MLLPFSQVLQYIRINTSFVHFCLMQMFAWYLTGVVRDSIAYRAKNNVSRNDFMELLIKLLKNAETDAENSITFNELAAQAFIFFMAGFETSSSTLTFCLYELALQPEIQAKARHAIKMAYQKYGGDGDGNVGQLTYEMMMDMPYVDQILEGKCVDRFEFFFSFFERFFKLFWKHCRNIAKISTWVVSHSSYKK